MSKTGSFSAQQQPQQAQQDTSGIDKTAMGFARGGSFDPSLTTPPKPASSSTNQGIDISSFARANVGSRSSSTASSTSTSGSGGGTGKTQVSADEMSDLAMLLNSTSELLNDAVTSVTSLQQLGYYEDGMALDKFAMYPMAFMKISDLVLHYQRMASLIEHTNQEFAATDNYISSKLSETQEPSVKGKGGRVY